MAAAFEIQLGQCSYSSEAVQPQNEEDSSLREKTQDRNLNSPDEQLEALMPEELVCGSRFAVFLCEGSFVMRPSSSVGQSVKKQSKPEPPKLPLC